MYAGDLFEPVPGQDGSLAHHDPPAGFAPVREPSFMTGIPFTSARLEAPTTASYRGRLNVRVFAPDPSDCDVAIDTCWRPPAR